MVYRIQGNDFDEVSRQYLNYSLRNPLGSSSCEHALALIAI